MNVLRGEMSIVGTHLFTNAPGTPFPSLGTPGLRPGLVTWDLAIDDQREIVDTAESIDRSIDSDRYYVENCSFLFDMKILFQNLFSRQHFYTP